MERTDKRLLNHKFKKWVKTFIYFPEIFNKDTRTVAEPVSSVSGEIKKLKSSQEIFEPYSFIYIIRVWNKIK